MTYNLKKMVAAASVAALMFGAASTAGAVDFSNVSPQGLTPAAELALSTTDPFIDLYSFDLDAGAGLVFPSGNVVVTITTPINTIFTSQVTAASLPGVNVSAVGGGAVGSNTVSFTLNGAGGLPSLSFMDLEIGLTSCNGAIGTLNAIAVDDNNVSIGSGPANFPAVVTDPQLVGACVSALDLSVTSDAASSDTLVLQSDGTLSPDGVVGAIQYTVNRDAVINGDEDFLTSACLSQIDFEIFQDFGTNNGIQSADIEIRAGQSKDFDPSTGIAAFSVGLPTDSADITDLMNALPDPIVLVEGVGPISASGVFVQNSVAFFNNVCGAFIVSESHASMALDALDTPGVETHGIYDWVNGGAAALAPSIWRIKSSSSALTDQLPDVAIPLTVTLTNANPVSANGVYDGMVTPVEGQIILDSRAFGIPGLDFETADVQLGFQFGPGTPTDLDVDRYVVTVGGGITAYADGANDILNGTGFPSVGTPVSDPAFVPVP